MICRTLYNVNNKIWLFWNSHFIVNIINDTNQQVTCSMKHSCTRTDLQISFVYAKCRTTLKRTYWQHLVSISKFRKMKESKAEKGISHRPKGHRPIRSKKKKYSQQNRKTINRLILGPSSESENFITYTSKSLEGFHKEKVATNLDMLRQGLGRCLWNSSEFIPFAATLLFLRG